MSSGGSTSRVQRAAVALFGVGALVSLVIGAFDALTIHQALQPAIELFSTELRLRVWWDWFEGFVPLVIVPGVVAVALRADAEAEPYPPRARDWLPLLGACVWFAGAVAAQLPLATANDGGWFNYAPDAGSAFSSDGALARYTLAVIVAWVGLTIAAVASTLRLPSITKDRSSELRWTTRLTLFSQPVVAVLGTLAASRLVWLLIDNPGMWGRT